MAGGLSMTESSKQTKTKTANPAAITTMTSTTSQRQGGQLRGQRILGICAKTPSFAIEAEHILQRRFSQTVLNRRKFMKRQLLRFAPWVALMVLGVLGTSQPANTTPQPRHPRIAAAVENLRAADEELRTAAHDFCGHREEARRAVDGALRQLRLAMECAR